MPEEISEQTISMQDLTPKMRLEGVVTRTELYGAFVNIGAEREGLVHISHLAPQRTKKVTDKVSVGDKVTVWVLNVDPQEGRIALSMIEPPDVDWDELEVGQIYTGKVVRMERYGAFVDIGAERPGLLHVREMGEYVRTPNEMVKDGEEVEVKVIKLDRRKRQIDLTTQLEPDVEAQDDDQQPFLSPMEAAFLAAESRVKDKPRSAPDRPRDGKKKDRKGNWEEIYNRTLEQGK